LSAFVKAQLADNAQPTVYRRFVKPQLMGSAQPTAFRHIAVIMVLLSLPPLAMAWEAPPLLEGAIKVTAEELLDLKAEFDDLIIIDTRPSNTASSLSIEGAITPSEQTLSAHTLASLTKDKFTPLVIFGADEHSVHSYKAARQAVTLGYSYVFWFRGGFQEWLDKGMPVVKIQK
jgi:rhodanese-related sulfurtransferase